MNTTARRAPLWTELSRLASYERPLVQPKLFEGLSSETEKM